MDLSEALKTIFYVGVGASAEVIETAQKCVDKLAEKGEITVNKAKIFNEELKHNRQTEKMNEIFSEISAMSKDDREVLRRKLAELDDKEEA